MITSIKHKDYRNIIAIVECNELDISSKANTYITKLSLIIDINSFLHFKIIICLLYLTPQFI